MWVRIVVSSRRRGGRYLREVRGVAIATGRVGWCWCWCWLSRVRLFPDHQLSGNRGVQAQVLIKLDARIRKPLENLNRDLALHLSREVKLDDGVHTLENLALDDGISWKPRAQEHDVRLKASVLESSLDPGHKLPWDFLKK
jgi:hypothetical protein